MNGIVLGRRCSVGSIARGGRQEAGLVIGYWMDTIELNRVGFELNDVGFEEWKQR